MQSKNYVVLIVCAALLASFFMGACASTKDEPPRTEVRGTFVADAAEMEREIDDEEVALFAEAYVEVMAIQQRYHRSITEADGEDQTRLIEESEAEIEEAILRQGLTTDQFNGIAVRMPLDDELRGRVQVQIKEREARRLQELREAEGLE